MSDREQTKAFANEIDKLVERFRSEYDMTYAQIVGVLHMKSWLMCEEASEQDADEGDSWKSEQ